MGEDKVITRVFDRCGIKLEVRYRADDVSVTLDIWADHHNCVLLTPVQARQLGFGLEKAADKSKREK